MSLTPPSLRLTRSTNFATPSPESRMFASICKTASLAPPCSGPDSAWIPAEIDAYRLAPVDPTSRTVEVEAFCSWSSCKMSRRSSAFASVGAMWYGSAKGDKVDEKKIGQKVECVVRVQERLPEAFLVRIGGNDGQFGEQPDGRELHIARIMRVGGGLVVGRQPPYRAGEHRHRGRGMRQRLEDLFEVFVQKGVSTNFLVEFTKLVGGRQRPAEQ